MENNLENRPVLPNQEKINSVVDTFFEVTETQGFRTENNRSINTENDSTLLFVNSTMATHKEEILEGKIPNEGYAISQNCLRMHGLSTYLDREKDFKFNSYFTMIGVLFPGKDHRDVLSCTIDFFAKIGFDRKRICIKTSDTNTHVNQCINSNTTKPQDQILFDTEQEGFYSWVYGLGDIYGQGITLSYRDTQGELKDLGNIISILNKKNEVIAWESGFGVETILGIKDDEDLFRYNRIWDIIEYQDNVDLRKIADCIISVIAILNEGVSMSSKGQGYILKKYLTIIYYLNQRISLPIKDIILQYCNTFDIRDGAQIVEKYEEFMNQINESKKRNKTSFLRYKNKNKNKNKNQLIRIAKESFSLELCDLKEVL